MKSSKALVSVVIPAYRCAAFINETLESVYKQTYTNWEIILVDDGSTDDTRAVLSPHMHRIRYIYQENKGTAAARNTGLREAKGEMIAFLDDDDLWLPEKLELQVRAMQAWPDCGLVFTDGEIFGDSGILGSSVISKGLSQWIQQNRTGDSLVVKGWLSREFFFLNQISSASSVMLRRECVDTVGRFDEGITIADDYDLWLRIAQRYPMVLIYACLYLWRLRDDSQSGPRAERQTRWIEASIVVLEKHWPISPKEIRPAVMAHLSTMYWRLARTYFWQDQFRKSRRMFVGYLRHNRLSVPALFFLVVSCLRPSFIRRLRSIKRAIQSRWQPRNGRSAQTKGSRASTARRSL